MAMKRSLTVVALAVCCAVGVQAQMGGGGGRGGGMGGGGGAAPPQTIPPGTAINPAKILDTSVTQIETLWMGAANAMPADKYSFAPSAAMFAPGQKVKYDGVRTFAQLATHTIQANYGIFSALSGLKPDVDVKSIADLKSKDDIVKALAATFAFAHKAVATITPANSFLSIRGLQTPASLFASAIGHAEDEYGQAVEYLRMNGIVPPASAEPMGRM
jgi:hypothetical protein